MISVYILSASGKKYYSNGKWRLVSRLQKEYYTEFINGYLVVDWGKDSNGYLFKYCDFLLDDIETATNLSL